jgi:hypothetical protein
MVHTKTAQVEGLSVFYPEAGNADAIVRFYAQRVASTAMSGEHAA